MRYGYYPGCSLEGISAEYDVSLHNLFDRLGVQVEEVPDWICCGTTAAPSTSRLLGLAVPLWNVARAAHAGQDTLIAPCSACLYHSKNALHKLRQDPSLIPQVEDILGLPLNASPRLIHPIELLSRPEFEKTIREQVVIPLSDLKAVCYYGCLLTRPPKVMQFDVAEYPQSMDRILQWSGIETLDWTAKTECCGGYFSLIDPQVVIDLSRHIFAAAQSVGANAIIVACPLCQANLDTREKEIEERCGEKFDLPILYFSQVMGLALGIPEEGLGLWKHVVEPGQFAKCLKNAPEPQRIIA
ncbi:MAG: CoB--CoM heterodisulfide reductase iron-sulfur subunit B family protein [Chloroflexota bacterium]|nr:CoB--CoM heterodisulfide reductase iron-sulfur subunit B family protein [Chloroflexota bacterium]